MKRERKVPGSNCFWLGLEKKSTLVPQVIAITCNAEGV